ncbi:hypothetical protein ACWPOB_11840 [Rhodococcus sp. 2H158]
MVAGRVNSYVVLLTSDVVNQLVVDELGLPETAREVAGKVSATVVPPRTSIIDITVTDRYPDRARLIADALAREFVGYVEALETPTGDDGQKVNTRIASSASEPQQAWVERAGPAAAILLAGPFLGAVAVWIRSRTDPIVRTADRAVTVSGVPVLGRVDGVDSATDSDMDGYRRLRLRLRLRPDPRAEPGDRAQVWVVTSAAGEADTATLASNLGRVTASTGDRTLVVHTDERGSRAEAGTRGPAWTESPQRDGAPGLPDSTPGLTGYPSDPPTTIATDATDPTVTIDRLRPDYAQVIVAAPAVLSTCTASIAGEHADGILLAAVLDVTRRRDLSRAVECLRTVGAPVTGVVLSDGAEKSQSTGFSR